MAKGATKMAKISKFITENVTVNFSHLNRPDDKFGADTANFNITVALTAALEQQIKDLVKSSGAKKVNGVWENENGDKLIKFKNRIMVKNGDTVFPCVDSRNQPTKATAMAGDIVRLLLSPALIQRDNSLSIYLDGVQIVQKNNVSAGFEVIEDGFTDDGGFAPINDDPNEYTEDEAPVAPADGDDDLPF
jgi:hypothetical protein